MPDQIGLSSSSYGIETLRSLLPGDVAGIFTAAGLLVVERVDPSLSGLVARINQELIATPPPIDVHTPGTRDIDPVRLEQVFAFEQEARSRRRELFDDILQQVVEEPSVMRRLVEHVTRLGHLIKTASPFAHENLIEARRPRRDEIFANYSPASNSTVPNQEGGIPRSLEQEIGKMINRGLIPKTAQGIREAQARVTLSYLITSHPTRYTLPEFTGVRSRFFLAARNLTNSTTGPADLMQLLAGQGESFETLKDFWKTPITPTATDSGPANFTPMTEIVYGMSYFKDLFVRIIDNTYRKDDDAKLRILGSEEYNDEERLLSQLNIFFKLWMMGDKDGSNNIRSEHLAPLAVLMFRGLGAELHAAQLRAMEAEGLSLRSAPDGGLWSSYLESKSKEINRLLAPMLDRITASGGIDLPLSRREYLEALDALDAMYGGPNGIKNVDARLQNDLEAAYRGSEGEAQKLALSLLRKSRMFGLGMTGFHLRETSEKYEHVVATLLQGDPDSRHIDYRALSPEEKKQHLNDLMDRKSPAELASLKDKFFDRFSDEETLHMRDYADAKGNDDPLVYTFHTLQRFEAGARQQGLITDQILAECEGALNIMETLFLSRITGLNLTIAPLLEEKKTLTQAPEIFRDAFGHTSYRDYMWDKCEGDLTKIINLLKVVFAHSDNMRLMGLPAARAHIYAEVHRLEEAMRKFMPELLDLYIADGRITATDKTDILARMDADPFAYEIQQFHGGSKCDEGRGGVRSTYAFTDDLGAHKFFEETFQGADTSELSEDGRAERLFTTLIAHNALRVAEKLNGQGKVWNSKRENALRDVIDKSTGDYEKNHYHGMLGVAMGEAGADALNKAYNNPGSRGERTASGGIKSCRPGELGPVAPSKMRTISFTTTNKDMGISVSMLPMRNMLSRVNKLYAERQDLREELADDAMAVLHHPAAIFENGKLTKAGIQTLYQVSQTFRAAVVDFPAFGDGTSDPQFTVDLLNKRAGRGSKPASPEVVDYFNRSIPKDIVAAGVLGLKSVGYDVPEQFISPDKLANPDAETCTRMTFLVRKLVLPHLEEQMSLGEHMHEFGRTVREAVIAKGIRDGNEPLGPDAAYMMRMTGILRSLYSHVFYDGAFDRSVAIARREECRRNGAANLMPTAA
jgi:hypothetical protein